MIPVQHTVLNHDCRLTATRDNNKATSASVRFGKPSNVLRYSTNVISRQLIGSRVRLRLVSVAEHDVNIRHHLGHGVFVRVTSVRS